MKCLGDIFIPWFLDDAQGFYFRLGWTTQWWDVVDLFISLFFSFPFTRFWYIFFNFYIRTTMIPWNLDSRILFPFGLNQRCWLCGSFHFLKDFSFSFDKITIHLIWDSFLQLWLLCKNDLILIIWTFDMKSLLFKFSTDIFSRLKNSQKGDIKNWVFHVS